MLEKAKTIGEIVRELRGDLTQKEFGELIEAPPSVISDIENNKREPSKKIAKILSNLSGKPVEIFFN